MTVSGVLGFETSVVGNRNDRRDCRAKCPYETVLSAVATGRYKNGTFRTSGAAAGTEDEYDDDDYDNAEGGSVRPTV